LTKFCSNLCFII